ncbi:MAG: hypothetical protein IBX57_01820 [Gammaproteobacteria bacterium]|nr:hypothetical protein [Gammaproteobacteria bacterium]
MTQQQSHHNQLKQQQAQQLDRFRFCDLSHPVMQQLINFKLKSKSTTQHGFD